MVKKMYYTEKEAAEALGISAEQFASYIRDNKVRVFQDGPRKMFRVDEIEALAGQAVAGGEEQIELEAVEQAAPEEVELTPADSGVVGGEEIELAAVEQAAPEEVELTPADSGVVGGEEIELAAVEQAAPEEVELTPADSGVVGEAEIEPAGLAGAATQPLEPTAPDREVEVPPSEPAEKGAAAEAGISFEKTVQLDQAAELAAPTEADTGAEPVKSKEDTVITAEGISIFDEEDLEIEAADPLAKTQIAPTLEDQVSIDGVGSGSGLLDLTRESDDTSLGAEVLDHIDETEGAAELEPASPVPEVEPYEPQPVAPAVVAGPRFVEEVDATAGMFSGMVVGCALVALLLGSIPLASARGAVPGYLEWYKENLLAVVIGAAVLVGAATVVGLFLGKAIAAKQQAMRDMRI